MQKIIHCVASGVGSTANVAAATRTVIVWPEKMRSKSKFGMTPKLILS